MATVRPFCGIRYHPSVGATADLTAPPYDVISTREQAEYYAQHPYNIIRLILNNEGPETGSENRSQKAAGYLRSWLQTNVLIKDEPSVYIYSQEFSINGNTFVRTGAVAALALEELGADSVFPHEYTLSKPKAEQQRLIEAAEANLSSIFGIYNGDPIPVPDQPPIMEATDKDGVVNRVWQLRHQDAEDLCRTLSGQNIFIADGHHRYETAYAFSQSPKGARLAGGQHVMMTFVPVHDPGMIILPTHRVLKFAQTDGIWENVDKHFHYEDACEGELLPQIPNGSQGAFGLYGLGRHGIIRLADTEAVAKRVQGQQSPAWCALDVAVLDALLVSPWQNQPGVEISYTHDEASARELVDSKVADLAIMVRPTPMESVIEIAKGGERMPPKSTYFYPKLLSGLLLNDLNNRVHA